MKPSASLQPDDLQAAIDELLSSGFHRAELSLLAGEHAVNEKLGGGFAKRVPWQTTRLFRERRMFRLRRLATLRVAWWVAWLCRRNRCCRRSRHFRRNNRRRHRCGNTGRRSRRRCRFGPGQMAGRSPRALSADANRSWRPAAVGANQGRQGRRARRGHPEETFVTGCSRAHAVAGNCGSLEQRVTFRCHRPLP